jgi:hypothetical protein
VRTLSLHPDPASPQAPEAAAQRRWTERQCELRLEDRLDRLEDRLDDVTRVGRDLTTVLARIAAALERQAAS